MAIWLLAIETSLETVVGLAFWYALFARTKSRAVYLLFGMLFWLFSAGGFVALLCGAIAFRQHGLGAMYVPQAALLAAASAFGGGGLLIFGALRHGDQFNAQRWKIVRTLIACIAVVAVHWVTHHQIDERAKIYTARVKAQAAKDYAAITHPLPAVSDNARDLYLESFSLYKSAMATFDAEHHLVPETFPPPGPSTTNPATPATQSANADKADLIVIKASDLLSPENLDRPESAELLRRLSPAMDLARRAASRPDCRFDASDELPSVLMDLKASHLNDFRTAVRSFAAHAITSAQAGRVDAAIADVGVMNHMAAHVDRTQPIEVCGLVRVGLQNFANDTLLKILPYVSNDAAIPPDILPDEQYLAASFDRDVRGEQASMLGTFLQFANGRFGQNEPVQESAVVGSYYRVLFLHGDVDLIQSDITRYREIIMGVPTSGALATTIHASPLSQMLLPALRRIPSVHLELVSNTRQMRIAIALTRYRLRHGVYPVKLEEMIPDILTEIPADPFDRKPIRYRVEAGEAVVSALTADRKLHTGELKGEHRTAGFRLPIAGPKHDAVKGDQ